MNMTPRRHVPRPRRFFGDFHRRFETSLGALHSPPDRILTLELKRKEKNSPKQKIILILIELRRRFGDGPTEKHGTTLLTFHSLLVHFLLKIT